MTHIVAWEHFYASLTNRADAATVDWWAHWDSNPEPKDYESSALTVEL